MDHTKRLYLIDKFDREYKRMQCPSTAVAKVPYNSTVRSATPSSTITKRRIICGQITSLSKRHHTTATLASPKMHRRVTKDCHSIDAIHPNAKTDTTAFAAAVATASTAAAVAAVDRPHHGRRRGWRLPRHPCQIIPYAITPTPHTTAAMKISRHLQWEEEEKIAHRLRFCSAACIQQ